MIDSTNPRVMADNIRELSNTQATQDATLEAEIEALGSYSETEADTGKKWIDGSNIYRKVIKVEAFPNNTTLNIQHNIENLGVVVNLYGILLLRVGAVAGRMFVGAGSPQLNYSSTVITIGTSSDMSSDSGFVIMEYTKAPAGLLAPNPDDMRSLEEPEREIEPEPIEEKK